MRVILFLRIINTGICIGDCCECTASGGARCGLSVNESPTVHSKQQYAHNDHYTTHIELYIGNIFAKNISLITDTYKINEHYIRVIVSVI